MPAKLTRKAILKLQTMAADLRRQQHESRETDLLADQLMRKEDRKLPTPPVPDPDVPMQRIETFLMPTLGRMVDSKGHVIEANRATRRRKKSAGGQHHERYGLFPKNRAS